MKKTLSSKVRLDMLSQATNIPISKLKLILDGNFTARNVSFLDGAHPIPEKIITPPKRKQKNVLEEIEDCEEVDDLYQLLSRLSFNDSEFSICYEKLVNLIKEDSAGMDEDKASDLFDSAPSGSPEEKELDKQIIDFEIKNIIDEDDFDELISMYGDDNLRDTARNYLIEKIIKIANTPEMTSKLLDDVFPDDSLEYYSAAEAHIKVVSKAIDQLTSPDDSDEIAQYISSGSDEEILLAQKIISVAKTPEAIMDREDDFDDGSEAQEILILGAIEKFDDYENDDYELGEIINKWDTGSRVNRAATKKRSVILFSHLKSLTDPDDMETILDELEDGTPQKKALIERIVETTNDLDELHTLTENSNKYITVLAENKLKRLLLEKFGSATSINDIENDDQYVADYSTEESELEKKLVELCVDPDDITIRQGSYAMYLLANKFSTRSKVAKPVVEEIKEVEVEENTNPVLNKEFQDRLRSRISNANIEQALEIFRSDTTNTDNKELAYKRASSQLISNLSYIDESRLCEVLYLFPEGSKEWILIVKKIAGSYEKPWWMFW